MERQKRDRRVEKRETKIHTRERTKRCDSKLSKMERYARESEKRKREGFTITNNRRKGKSKVRREREDRREEREKGKKEEGNYRSYEGERVSKITSPQHRRVYVCVCAALCVFVWRDRDTSHATE